MGWRIEGEKNHIWYSIWADQLLYPAENRQKSQIEPPNSPAVSQLFCFLCVVVQELRVERASCEVNEINLLFNNIIKKNKIKISEPSF